MIIIPDALNVNGEYPIAALNASINPDLAQKFVDFVLSAEGQLILEDTDLKSAE